MSTEFKFSNGKWIYTDEAEYRASCSHLSNILRFIMFEDAEEENFRKNIEIIANLKGIDTKSEMYNRQIDSQWELLVSINEHIKPILDKILRTSEEIYTNAYHKNKRNKESMLFDQSSDGNQYI